MSPTKTNPPPQAPEIPPMPWHARLTLASVTFWIFLLAVIFAAYNIRGPGRDLDYIGSLWRFIVQFFPPDLSAPVLKQIAAALLETVEIALLATFFSVIISFVLAMGAAQNIAPMWLVVTIRMVLNAIRTIPSLIWALLAVAVVGANPLAGVIGLTFYSVGYLGKFFSEAFESVNVDVARGLRAIGADPLQAFQFGLWPHARPLIWSYALWMLEYNIRSAAIVGYVGAGGIGLQLFIYQEHGEWNRFGTVFFCILLVVTSLDFLGERIRRKITSADRNKTLSE